MRRPFDKLLELITRRMQAPGARLEARCAAPSAAPTPGLDLMLGMAAVVYGGVHRVRPWLYRSGLRTVRRLPCRVASIGNLTVGGTAKTPLAIDLARRMRGRGRRVAVLSRGYKGTLERRGGVVSDGRNLLLGPHEAGDEPYLIASRLAGVPVLVGRDRHAAGLTAWRRYGAECLVLDDGFQHLPLFRDLNLLLLDFEHPFGNGRLLPRGPLRESVSALQRADAVVVTRTPPEAGSGSRAALIRRIQGLMPGPVFFAAGEPYGYVVARGSICVTGTAVCEELAAPAISVCRRRRALAFSGIARNDDFRDTLRRGGMDIAAALSFPDHHAYTPQDAARVVARARSAGADLLVTTDKDHARIDRVAWPLDLLVVGVRIVFDRDEDAFDAFIEERFGEKKSKPCVSG